MIYDKQIQMTIKFATGKSINNLKYSFRAELYAEIYIAQNILNTYV